MTVEFKVYSKEERYIAKKIIELLADIDVDMIEPLISRRKLLKSDLQSAKVTK